MGDGTKSNPYTREDVKKMIEDRAGMTEGLNLSRKWFKQLIDLSELDLKGVNLKKAHLVGAEFSGTHLEGACVEGAVLLGAEFEGAFLYDIKFSDDTDMRSANWGSFILGEYREPDYWKARDTYRRFKLWYTNQGIYEIAGRFHYCEMEAKRKSLNWRRFWYLKIWNWILMVLCGYGESWWKVIRSAFCFFALFTLLYFFLNNVWSFTAIGRSLYFSAVSFTALGYGSWTNTWFTSNIDSIRGLGAAESFVGVFMMALFLVTFTRKMTR